MYAFWVGVIAAAMTSFYSWRLWFKTFSARRGRISQTYEHAHESPMRDADPALRARLRRGRSPASSSTTIVVHHGAERVLGIGRSSISAITENTVVLHDAHNVPQWVKLCALRRDADRLRRRDVLVLRGQPRACRTRLARATRPLHAFLQNKWYFDELYDFFFVRPAMWIGRALLAARRRRRDRRRPSTASRWAWRRRSPAPSSVKPNPATSSAIPA